MKIKNLFFIMSLVFLSYNGLEARINLIEFSNESNLAFQEVFVDGTPYREMLNMGQDVLIDQEGAQIESVDGNLTIILEDAKRSGFHRPHWKYHIWLESKVGFPFMTGNRILYAVVFYDGDGELKLNFDKKGKLHVSGGYDVKDILYPWAKGTIGRGNPYHEIKGVKTDQNGIKYFDYRGFVGYPFNQYRD